MSSDKATRPENEPEPSLEELRQEAVERVAASDGAEPHNRKCWFCDSIKEYLKEYPFVIACYQCNRILYKGVDITQPDEEQDETSKKSD